MRPSFLAVGFFALIGAQLSCQSAAPPPSSPSKIEVGPGGLAAAVIDLEAGEGEAPAKGFPLVAQIPSGSFGPRLLETTEGHVAVWATLEGEKPGFYSAHIPEAGPPAKPLWLAEVSPTIRHLELGRLAGGGVGVLSIHKGGQREILEVMQLGPQGELRTAQQLVSDTPAAILWSQVVPTAGGAMLLWAERRASTADLYSAPLGESGTRVPTRVVRGAFAWQLAARKGSLALVSLEDESTRSVVLRLLGENGKMIGASVELAKNVDGGLDLDMAMTDQRIVVAWGQKDAFGTRLRRSVLDGSGNIISEDAPLTPPRGEQALMRLIPSSNKGEILALWEEPLKSAHQGRSLLLGTVSDKPATTFAQAVLPQPGDDPLLPLVDSTTQGVAILSQARACKKKAECPDAPHRYLGLEFSATGAPGRVIELSAGLPEGTATMTWDLNCSEKGCAALVADDSRPARVYFAPWKKSAKIESPLASLEAPSYPRAREVEPLASLPELSDMAGARTSAGGGPASLIAWLSYFDPNRPYVATNSPAPDGRRAPVRARLTTMLQSEQSSPQPSSPETIISYRARSLGGVSLVPPQKGEGLLLWAAVDNKVPQLFATLIDESGRKIRQKMLTRSPGEVTWVAGVRSGAGYVIAWVDGRADRPEIWSLFLDARLRVASGPQKVTTGARSPTSLSLVHLGSEIRAVWSDSRGHREGQADLYQASLDPKTGKSRGVETRLHESALHSHSPKLALLSNQPGSPAALAWIESPLSGHSPGGRGGSLQWMKISAGGAKGKAMPSPKIDGAADFDLECEEGKCRALVGLRGASAAELWGVMWDTESAPQASALVHLRASSATAVTPRLVAGTGFFVDESPSRDSWVLTRLRIDWGKTQ